MRAKEYLQQVRVLDIKINNRIKQKDDLLSKIQSISLAENTPDRVQTGRNLDPLGTDMAKYLDMEREIVSMIDALVAMKDKIIGEIHQLHDPVHIDLLFKRYVECKTWEQIAVEMNYTIRWIYSLHGSALQEFTTVHCNTCLLHDKV